MTREMEMYTLKKHVKTVHVPKDLHINKCWQFLRKDTADHIGGVGYTAVPYFFDAKCYQIGHIFVQEASNIQCFCVEPQMKLLGPIRDFVLSSKTNKRWLEKDLPLITTTGDNTNFRVILENERHKLQLRANDCYFLDKAPDLQIVGQVTIDRSSHEEFASADWFGLITGGVVASSSDLHITRNSDERTFFIGDRHFLLFKYEICKIDRSGTVQETTTTEIECKWLPVKDIDMLPLNQLVSQSKYKRP